MKNSLMTQTAYSIYAACIIALAGAAQAAAPLTTEISTDHPLFIFQAPGDDAQTGAEQASAITDAWASIPDSIRPLTVLKIAAPGDNLATRHNHLRTVLATLQADAIPVVVQVADADPNRLLPIGTIEELLQNFTTIKGVHVAGLRFNQYHTFGENDSHGTPPEVRWLNDLIRTASEHGRFSAIELAELDWPRIMSNAWCRALYDTIYTYRDYVIPVSALRGDHTLTRNAALLGLWLEGAVNQWGLAPTSTWYTDARFIRPGIFGVSEADAAMPPTLYRAMILNGVMSGATAYLFPNQADLWSGAQRHYWDQAIFPTLTEIVNGGFIARPDLVKRKVKVAYQLGFSKTTADFHRNLADIDPVYDVGKLIHGAYGVEQPGQVPELIPNAGNYYWVPIVSPYASYEALGIFEQVVSPGTNSSPEAWKSLLDQHYTADGQGTAFISRVGRGIFVLNTRENLFEEQTFEINSVPTPVRGIKVQRTSEGIKLTWPFREGDFSYRVYRRVLPETEFTVIEQDLEDWEYLDQSAHQGDTVAYALTALTNEQETYNGTLNFGDYLMLSGVESRIAEEVTVYPLTETANSSPTRKVSDIRPKRQAWWPTFDGVSPEQRPDAETIATLIETLDNAIETEDLDGVMGLYAEDYSDSEGWGNQYARRAYQWFFERYDACKFDRQIREWDFSDSPEDTGVRVRLYCRVSGVAPSNVSGNLADIPVQFPNDADAGVWLTFKKTDEDWRISTTEPPLPNFSEILPSASGQNYSPTPTTVTPPATEITQEQLSIPEDFPF